MKWGGSQLPPTCWPDQCDPHGPSLAQTDLERKVTAGVKWLSKWTTCGVFCLGEKRDIFNLILYNTLGCSLGIVVDPSRLNSLFERQGTLKDMFSHAVGLTSDHVWWILCLCAWLLPGNLSFPLLISCMWPPRSPTLLWEHWGNVGLLPCQAGALK